MSQMPPTSTPSHRSTASLLAMLACALSLAVPAVARAAPSDVAIFADRNLGETFVDAVRTPDGSPAGQTSGEAACQPYPTGIPRIAVLAYEPKRPEIDVCERKADADVLALEIGYQAAAIVAPANTPVFALRSADLFNAVARHAGGQRAPAVWRDVDADLPSLQVGFLAPPPGSSANRMLVRSVMEPACTDGRHADLPFESARRSEFCGALRTDPTIVERKGGTTDIANWAASAPAGQLAVVTLAELRELDQAVVAVPLDGVLPTAANVATGLYPAAQKVALLIVVPHETTAPGRAAVRRMAFDLLSEASVGPDGRLTAAGLVPRAPSERIAARSQAMTFTEHH